MTAFKKYATRAVRKYLWSQNIQQEEWKTKEITFPPEMLAVLLMSVIVFNLFSEDIFPQVGSFGALVESQIVIKKKKKKASLISMCFILLHFHISVITL